MEDVDDWRHCVEGLQVTRHSITLGGVVSSFRHGGRDLMCVWFGLQRAGVGVSDGEARQWLRAAGR